MKINCLFFYLVILFNVVGCVSMQKPEVELEAVRFLSMDFESVQLAFDLKVHNPNRIGITLSNWDHDFQLYGHSLLKSEQKTPQSIDALMSSKFEVPVQIRFQEVFQIVKELSQQDTLRYHLFTHFGFDVPLLGRVEIPLEKEGDIPLPKIPEFQIKTLRLNDISLTKAELVLEMNIKNPNTFALSLPEFRYQFLVQNQPWVETNSSISLEAKKENTISVPISLSFLQMGRSVYTLLTGNQPLNCKLSGNFVIQIALPFFKKDLHFPLELQAQVPLQKS